MLSSGPCVRARRPLPSALTTYTSQWELSRRAKAIFLPSGDQVGAASSVGDPASDGCACIAWRLTALA